LRASTKARRGSVALGDENDEEKERVQKQLRRRSVSDSDANLVRIGEAPHRLRERGGNPQAEEGDLGIEWRDLGLVRFLRETATSIVFCAHLAGREVAVKLLKSDAGARDCQAEEKWASEAALYAMHQSSNIAEFVALGGGGKFLVLERLSETLDERLGAARSWRVEDVVPWFMRGKKKEGAGGEWRDRIYGRLANVLELAKAVRYCHIDMKRDSCVLHRDINPCNIGFRGDGTCVLFDFGNATVLEGYRAHVKEEVPREMTGGIGSER
jgi:serine/threonine protein kinase